ncbi:hypothetical protein GGF32_000752 [Allomyces javanicus]|nr:hypothetical protein GGF32_000752 [Allomyces javanicus]
MEPSTPRAAAAAATAHSYPHPHAPKSAANWSAWDPNAPYPAPCYPSHHAPLLRRPALHPHPYAPSSAPYYAPWSWAGPSLERHSAWVTVPAAVLAPRPLPPARHDPHYNQSIYNHASPAAADFANSDAPAAAARAAGGIKRPRSPAEDHGQGHQARHGDVQTHQGAYPHAQYDYAHAYGAYPPAQPHPWSNQPYEHGQDPRQVMPPAPQRRRLASPPVAESPRPESVLTRHAVRHPSVREPSAPVAPATPATAPAVPAMPAPMDAIPSVLWDVIAQYVGEPHAAIGHDTHDGSAADPYHRPLRHIAAMARVCKTLYQAAQPLLWRQWTVDVVRGQHATAWLGGHPDIMVTAPEPSLLAETLRNLAQHERGRGSVALDANLPVLTPPRPPSVAKDEVGAGADWNERSSSTGVPAVESVVGPGTGGHGDGEDDNVVSDESDDDDDDDDDDASSVGPAGATPAADLPVVSIPPRFARQVVFASDEDGARLTSSAVSTLAALLRRLRSLHTLTIESAMAASAWPYLAKLLTTALCVQRVEIDLHSFPRAPWPESHPIALHSMTEFRIAVRKGRVAYLPLHSDRLRRLKIEAPNISDRVWHQIVDHAPTIEVMHVFFNEMQPTLPKDNVRLPPISNRKGTFPRLRALEMCLWYWRCCSSLMNVPHLESLRINALQQWKVATWNPRTLLGLELDRLPLHSIRELYFFNVDVPPDLWAQIAANTNLVNVTLINCAFLSEETASPVMISEANSLYSFRVPRPPRDPLAPLTFIQRLQLTPEPWDVMATMDLPNLTTVQLYQFTTIPYVPWPSVRQIEAIHFGAFHLTPGALKDVPNLTTIVLDTPNLVVPPDTLVACLAPSITTLVGTAGHILQNHDAAAALPNLAVVRGPTLPRLLAPSIRHAYVGHMALAAALDGARQPTPPRSLTVLHGMQSGNVHTASLFVPVPRTARKWWRRVVQVPWAEAPQWWASDRERAADADKPELGVVVEVEGVEEGDEKLLADLVAWLARGVRSRRDVADTEPWVVQVQVDTVDMMAAKVADWQMKIETAVLGAKVQVVSRPDAGVVGGLMA